MSELINNSQKRKELLKHLILQLHQGKAPEAVKKQLRTLLGQVPYDQVVQVEQELISEGLPPEEVLRLCDLHSDVLKGSIDQSGAQVAPPGHPVHTFLEENHFVTHVTTALQELLQKPSLDTAEGIRSFWNGVQAYLRSLADIEKHYRRKENLLFPYLEKHGITGPPTVMWGKHDETRALLRRALETVTGREASVIGKPPEETRGLIEEVLKPLAASVDEMIFKEENILFPMCLDTLEEPEWYEIYLQGPEIGYCLYDPEVEWQPQVEPAEPSVAAAKPASEAPDGSARIRLASGSFSPAELEAMLNNLPVDITLVDARDTVRYFNQNKERIFTRTKAIIGRKVQQCHPPDSVYVVEKILHDFKSGAQDRAAFWINLDGKFVHIEYFALRSKDGEYLGTLEVSQDLTAKKKLQGEQRLLSYLSRS